MFTSLLSFCTATVLFASLVNAGGSPDMLSSTRRKTSGQPREPSIVDWDAHQWMAPGPDDLRGPCPGLNTLANHGFLPRDGRGLNMSVILDAGLDGFNMQPDILTIAVKIAFLTTNDPFSFTLDDLKVHGNIEHDASLSRGDFALGDNVHFNETIFSTLNNSNPGVDYFNTTSAGQVQHQRLADSMMINPNNLTNTVKEFSVRSSESAFYLSVMGDPISGVAPKEFVRTFFREERLPIAEGWHRPETPITLDTLTPLALDIVNASNWTSSGGYPTIVLSPEGAHF
ncbi:hypothetical protein VKT23_015159 [Stygiomarasmius scandens]|uniref:Heme haloperoxidase family profile domain-containing protein n=1 Tax=Marasmiellus scandens TaxID=2682957 RepID=A0ABR1J3C9_9AGAR